MAGNVNDHIHGPALGNGSSVGSRLNLEYDGIIAGNIAVGGVRNICASILI